MQMHLIVGSLIIVSIGCNACPEPSRRAGPAAAAVAKASPDTLAKEAASRMVGPDDFRRSSPDTYVPIVQKHVSCLRRVCNNECIKRFVDPVVFLQDNSAISYSHELTRLSLKKISVEGNLLPLFESWDIFLKNYRLVDSDLFIESFRSCSFLCIKIFFHAITEQKVTILEIMHLSSQIMSLPIDQLLTTLERCYHQFMIIYGTIWPQSRVSFSAWINRYWWVPPVVLISFVFRQLRHFFSAKATNIGLGGHQI